MALSSKRSRPVLPTEYKKPAKWDPEHNSAKEAFGGMNSDSARPRSAAELPVGKHRFNLYSCGTPNGIKVTTFLEELVELGKIDDYDAWFISIAKGDQFGKGFTELNPNQKIPALADFGHAREGAAPIRVFESASILLYLAEQFNVFLPSDPRLRTETLNWLFWVQGAAPFLGGGFGHFYKYAPLEIEYPIDRYSMEARRLFDVLDQQLEGKKYVVGDEPTVADFAIAPWFGMLLEGKGYPNSDQFLDLHSYKNVERYIATMNERPAFKRGRRVNGFRDDAVRNLHSRADFDSASKL